MIGCVCKNLVYENVGFFGGEFGSFIYYSEQCQVCCFFFEIEFDYVIGVFEIESFVFCEWCDGDYIDVMCCFI